MKRAGKKEGRDTRGRFKRGVSGNPQGRTKGVPNRSTSEFRDAVRTAIDWQTLLDALERMALEGNVPAARLLCAYAWGQASTVVEVEGQEAVFEPIDTKRLWAEAFGPVPNPPSPHSDPPAM